MTVVCIEIGLWSPSHGAGSSSSCTYEAFFIPKELTLPHYLHWKSVEAHQLKTLLCMMTQTLYGFNVLSQRLRIIAQPRLERTWKDHLVQPLMGKGAEMRGLFYYLLFPSLMLDVLQHLLVQPWFLLAIIQRFDNSRMET